MSVIQFTNLDQMLDELPQGHIVRLEALEITRHAANYGSLRVVECGVHVRCFADPMVSGSADHILACYIPCATVQVVGGNSEEHEAAWTQAKAEAQRVRSYLINLGLDVRHGIIDLGDVRPLRGGWNGGSA